MYTKGVYFNNDADISSMQDFDDIHEGRNVLGTGNKRIRCLREESLSFCLGVVTFLFPAQYFGFATL